MSQQLARRWFNTGEYSRMVEAGILTEDDRVELIEGEIVQMSPIGSRHAGCVNRLNSLLSSEAGQGMIVSVQNPIVLDGFSEPEPDIAVLKRRADYYAQEHPKPADVLLVIEVADTSVEIDRHVKVPLYARAGIPQTVLVDLPEEAIEVYAELINGRYQLVSILKRGDRLILKNLPHFDVSVDDILG